MERPEKTQGMDNQDYAIELNEYIDYLENKYKPEKEYDLEISEGDVSIVMSVPHSVKEFLDNNVDCEFGFNRRTYIINNNKYDYFPERTLIDLVYDQRGSDKSGEE
jgi:hypothetical protein